MSAPMTSTYKSRGSTSKGRRAPLPRCVECDMNFTNLNQWQEHRKRIHGIAASHLCTICSFASTDIQLLNHHLLKSHNIVQPRCIQCDLTFDNVPLWRSHCDQAHQGQKAYPCQKCSFITLDFNEYKEHIYTAHTIFGNKPSPITCQVCNEKFDSSNDLKLHEAKKHSAPIYKCVHCKYTTENKNELTEHVMTNLCDMFLRCEECGLLCKGMENLNKHMGVHKRDGKQSGLEVPERVRITTPQLNHQTVKAFVGQLDNSQNYNNGILQGLLSEKPLTFQGNATTSSQSAPTSFVAEPVPLFPCEHCSALFRNIEDWQLHQVTTHNATVLEAKKPNPSISNNKVIEMKCELCNVTFSNIGSWRKHIKDVHPLEAYVCYLCDFSSQRRGLIEKHLTAVHKVKDFPVTALMPHCKECSQSFATIKLWKSHRNVTHRKEEYFSCEDCDFSSSVYQFFNKHEKDEPIINNIGDTIQCIGPNCDKIFYSVLDYSAHRMKAHSHFYKCHLGCDFKTLVKEELVQHLGYHENPADGKRVVSARTVTPNILSRAKSKMINCEICAYKTNTRIRMTNHYRQTHRQLYEFQPLDNNHAGASTSSADTRTIDLPPSIDGSSIKYLQNLCQYADPTDSAYQSKLGKVALGKRNQNSTIPAKKLKYSTLNEGASTSCNPKIVHVTSLSGLAFNGIKDTEEVASEQRDQDFENQSLRPINLIDTQSNESGEYEMILPDLDYDEDDAHSNEATKKCGDFLANIKSEPDLTKVKTEPIDADETENRKIETQSGSTTGSTAQWDQHQAIKSEPQ